MKKYLVSGGMKLFEVFDNFLLWLCFNVDMKVIRVIVIFFRSFYYIVILLILVDVKVFLLKEKMWLFLSVCGEEKFNYCLLNMVFLVLKFRKVWEFVDLD